MLFYAIWRSIGASPLIRYAGHRTLFDIVPKLAVCGFGASALMEGGGSMSRDESSAAEPPFFSPLGRTLLVLLGALASFLIWDDYHTPKRGDLYGKKIPLLATPSTPPTVDPPGRLPDDSARNSRAVREILEHMEGFAGTSWGPSFKSVRIVGNAAIIEARGDSTNAQMEGLCAGISSYVFDQTKSHGLKGLMIMAGSRSLPRLTFSQRCSM